LVFYEAWLEVRPRIKVSLGRSYVTLFTFAMTALIRLLTKRLMSDDWVGEALVFLESSAMLLEFLAFCVFSVLDLIELIRAKKPSGP
jgi:uncharacterized membrane protein